MRRHRIALWTMGSLAEWQGGPPSRSNAFQRHSSRSLGSLQRDRRHCALGTSHVADSSKLRRHHLSAHGLALASDDRRIQCTCLPNRRADRRADHPHLAPRWAHVGLGWRLQAPPRRRVACYWGKSRAHIICRTRRELCVPFRNEYSLS